MRQGNDPRIDTRAERQAFWTQVRKDTKQPMAVRLKASELPGRSQADFVEVRVAPVVTDPHASVESLIERLHRIFAGIQARELLSAAPSKQLTADKC